jgi:hypothetical protein
MQFCIQKSTLINICADIILKIGRRRCEERDRAIEELILLHEKKILFIPFPVFKIKLKLSHAISLENALKITNGILPEEFNNHNDRDILCEPFREKEIRHEYATYDYWAASEHKIEGIIRKASSINVSNQIFLDENDEIYKIAEEFGVEI